MSLVDNDVSGGNDMKENIKGIELEPCCGCVACAIRCPTKAISMQMDDEGFLYPVISKEDCISCKRCISVCPLKGNKVRKDGTQTLAYGVKHKQDNIRMLSRSGGAFTALSDIILSKGGVVYGAAWEEGLRKVIHRRVTTQEERNQLRGSKYLSSDISGCYLHLRTDLEAGRLVLFTGTGCQIAAVASFLGKEYQNLYLCDIICHGVPSTIIFEEYQKFLDELFEDRIEKYQFRDKEAFGWKANIESFQINEKKRYSNLFSKVYQTDCIQRPYCYECQYASLDRCSDITIGDFWGIDTVMKNFKDNKGTSLVLVHTKKGQQLFRQTLSLVDFIDCSYENYLQPQLKKPCTRPSNRDEFWRLYKEVGVSGIIKGIPGGAIGTKNRIYSTILINRMKKWAGIIKLKGKNGKKEMG